MRINNIEVKAVPRLYDVELANVTPGSWWYPSSKDEVLIKCSSLRGDEHLTVMYRESFDEDGILSMRYSDFKCIDKGCLYGGRIWLVDFNGRQPVLTEKKKQQKRDGEG